MTRATSILMPMLLLAVVSFAGPTDRIAGEEFERLVASQHPEVQEALVKYFPESEGYFVLGPAEGFQLRLICVDSATHTGSWDVFDGSGKFPEIDFVGSKASGKVSGFIFEINNHRYAIDVALMWDHRLDIWRRSIDYDSLDLDKIATYEEALRPVLVREQSMDASVRIPRAVDFGLPAKCDFYAPPPDYVIEGYQNYKDFMKQHSAIRTDFAHDIYEIQPSDSLLEALKARAPREAYPNKEAAGLQHEFKKFFKRGGDLRSLNSLTTIGFDTLKAAEYFYAVGLSGRIRFGRELLREEVKRIESETGKKVPRANHAFLFPGEAVLTAGAFFIEIIDSRPTIVKVNAGSGHYFYSNISPTIREDIAERSNHYLLTLGHLFNSLDQLDISYCSITVSKF